jgi:hypothetical protein
MKKITGLFLLLIAVSCQKNSNFNLQNNEIEKVDEKIKINYGLSASNAKPSKQLSSQVLNELSFNGDIYKKVEPKLSLSNLSIQENKKEEILIVIIPFKGNDEKYYAVKGRYINEKFISETEVLLSRKVKDDKNGEIVILKEKESLKITVKDGIETLSSLSHQDEQNHFLPVVDCSGHHGGTGFCQREANESFSTCYSKEKEEFCTGFFSCLAVDTQASVLLLIALSCECSATQCQNNIL